MAWCGEGGNVAFQAGNVVDTLVVRIGLNVILVGETNNLTY